VLRFIAAVTNEDESVVVTNVNITFDSAPPLDISSSFLARGDRADFQNQIQFVTEDTVDMLTRKSYRYDFSYEGISTFGNDTAECKGADSASFTFGRIAVEGN